MHPIAGMLAADEGVVVGSAQETFVSMLRDDIAPALRGMGFKGSGRSYRLDDEACFIQLGFQSSKYSTGDAVSFTINLSVVGKEAWNRAREEHPHFSIRPAPNTYYGKFSWWRRIGSLMPGGQDQWWIIAAGQPTAPIAGEVVDAIREFGIPAVLAQRKLISDEGGTPA
jgi:hypothetical protein